MAIYMNYAGVAGTGTGKYKGWIELQSAQLGSHRPSWTGQGRDREASVPSVSEVVVTKSQDSASTGLYRESLEGKGKKVIIHFVTSDGRGSAAPYLSLELENTLISSFSVSGYGGDPHSRPMESLSLNFTRITFSATPVSASKDSKDLRDKAIWNLATGGSSSRP